MRILSCIAIGMSLLATTGCRNGNEGGPQFDRPFPVGQVSDSFWETQQTNAEAADFIFYDHEFEGNTALLAPGAKKKLMQVALRLAARWSSSSPAWAW